MKPHRFRLSLADKLNLKNPSKAWNETASTGNDEFDLPDGSYSTADIEGDFEFIIRKHETLNENPLVQIYPNKIKNRIGNDETIGEQKKDVGQDKDGEDVPNLESVEVVLVPCNLFNNN